MSSQPHTTPRILVVDDEPSICDCLTDALRAGGLDVSAATSGADAIIAARRCPPDLVITDLRLGDCSGLEVIDRLRRDLGDIPAVIITGHGDAQALSEASSRHPVQMLNKPIDVQRLRQTVADELQRLDHDRRLHRRQCRLRELTRRINRERRHTHRLLCSTCAELTGSCRTMQHRLDRQDTLIQFQQQIIGCLSADDIFCRLFRLFVERTGPVFGVAMLCDENAELQLVGRFGVPAPDGVSFSQGLASAMLNPLLQRPEVTVLDATGDQSLFPQNMRRRLVGVTVLAMPLMAGEGQMIGLAVLYRKGEQPFLEDDIALARDLAPSIAAACQRV